MGKKKRTQKQRKEKKVKKTKVQENIRAEKMYRLNIPTYIEEPALENLAYILQEELQNDGEVCGYGEYFGLFKVLGNCSIDFVARNTNKVIDRIISTLSDHGLPLGSELRQNDKVIKRIGRLHVIKVDLSYELRVSPIANEVFVKRFYSRTLSLLGGMKVFSSAVIDVTNHNAVLYFYVIDRKLALDAINTSIDNFRWFLGASIKTADSNMTIQEYFMNQITRPYRHFVEPIWRKMQQDWKGLKKTGQQELKRVFPETPQGLLDILSIVNGTWNQRFSDFQLKVPIFMFEKHELYLLSAEDMMKHSQEELEVVKPALEASVRPKGVRARLSQWNACLIAKSEDGKSRLYIDYNPTKEGVVGQVLLYDGQSQRIQVVAAMFAKFLAVLLTLDYHTYGLYTLQALIALLEANENKELEIDTEMVTAIQKGLYRLQTEVSRKMQEVEDERKQLDILPLDNGFYEWSDLIERIQEKWKLKHM